MIRSVGRFVNLECRIFLSLFVLETFGGGRWGRETFGLVVALEWLCGVSRGFRKPFLESRDFMGR